MHKRKLDCSKDLFSYFGVLRALAYVEPRITNNSGQKDIITEQTLYVQQRNKITIRFSFMGHSVKTLLHFSYSRTVLNGP